MKIYVPMDTSEIGEYLAYKWNAKFNYYIFTEGINVLCGIFVILLACISWGIYILFSSSVFPDAIENVKNLYLYAGLLSAGIITGLILIFSIWSKDEKKLLSHMIFTLILTAITIITLLGTKAYMNTIYTQEKFEEYFEEYCMDNEISKDEKEKVRQEFNIWRVTVEGKNLKDKYIEENMKLYQKFTIKSWVNLIILMCIFILNIYMITQIISKIHYKNILEKNDNILEDDEINVKI
ncbi:MAG: hypothetical protein J6A04_01470 [Clostridia bacterium]|nr:hypothetical protein [Clostridia bacterium]